MFQEFLVTRETSILKKVNVKYLVLKEFVF